MIFCFPFLLRYWLAVVPGRETLVIGKSFCSSRKPAYQHATMAGKAPELASANILGEYSQPKRKTFQWNPPAIVPGSCLATTPYVETTYHSFRYDVSI